MIKYFSKAFKITNENIILTTPLVLFLFIFSIYLSIAKNAPETFPSAILLILTTLFMFGAFFAGWFFMVKKALDLDKQEITVEEEKAKASFSLLKEIPVGVGEYFLPYTFGLILYTGLILVLLYLAYQIGLHFIGNVGITLNELRIALNSPAAMKSLVSSLSVAELTKLNTWNVLFLSFMGLFSFLTMFWGAHIVIKNKNPLMALFQSIGFIFKNLLPSIILFVYISFINFLVSLVNATSTINAILYFISMVIYFYFVVYVVVLVFLYYDSETNRPIKEKNEDNCDCGTDSVGEDGLCNPESFDE